MLQVDKSKFEPLLTTMRAKMLNEYGADVHTANFLVSVIGNAMADVAAEVLSGKLEPHESVERLEERAKERMDQVHQKFIGDSKEAVENRLALAHYIYDSLKH